MVQFSGRGASSWFMVSTLHGSATGARQFFPAPGSMLPHKGDKNGRGSPTPTAEKHASPRAWPLMDNHQPLTPTNVTSTTTFKPLLPQAHEALTWAAFCPLSPSLPALSSSPAHTDPRNPREVKPGAPWASNSSSTSSWSALSSGAKKMRW